MNRKSADDRLRLSALYGYMLDTGDAKELLQLSPVCRIAAMKALSCLAKFSGRYDAFQQLKTRYNLKWTTGTEKIEAFQRLFDEDKTMDKMVQYLKVVIDQFPSLRDIFLFATLTGLRASECLAAIRLLNDGAAPQYYNPDRQTIEHFRFPEIFVRRTKCAYISIVSPEIVEIARAVGHIPTYFAMRFRVERAGLPFNMGYCRKVFASHLRDSGIPAEFIDALQGRIGQGIFLRHYYSPSIESKDKVLAALHNLRRQIQNS
jgi:hypothetical protein